LTYQNPSVADFQGYFVRDFPYGTDPANNVIDADIAKAFQMTNINFNPGLFGDQASYAVCYLLLSAHYLVTNLRASSQGINGQWAFLEQSKSVGALSQSFAIPQRILDDPYFSVFTTTNYGMQYLQMILPQLCGQVFTVVGSTRP